MENQSREEKLIARIIEHCKAVGITSGDLSHITQLEPKLTAQLLSGDLTEVGYQMLKDIASDLGIENEG